jgi:transcription antitermination factor NusG
MARKSKKPEVKKTKPKIILENLPDSIWCIAYIHRDMIERLPLELKKYGYKIETYIPTVRVLKKKFKGKDIFEFVPLLFNYGFFKIDYKDACNPDFLMLLRSRISCIYGWVKDPASILNKPSIRSKDDYQAIPATAFAKDDEVAKLIKNSAKENIYTAEELNKFKKGDYITLKGYPFDNMPAEIMEINFKKKQIKVSLLLDTMLKEVTVSFDNVFYTVYQNEGYDDSVSNEVHLEDISYNKNRSLDKFLFDNDQFE